MATKQTPLILNTWTQLDLGPLALQASGGQVNYLVSPTQPTSVGIYLWLTATEFREVYCATTDQIWATTPFQNGVSVVSMPIVLPSVDSTAPNFFLLSALAI